MDPKELIHQYWLGNLEEDSVRKLDGLLAEDPELRREFALVANVDAALRETAIEQSIDEAQQLKTSVVQGDRPTSRIGTWLMAACSALAASTLLVVSFWNQKPSTVATLASSEDAAWVSTLPTSLGSKLTAGTLDLKAGIATLRFHSGAELTIEAPAELELLSEMRAKLNSGAAVMNVPDSATGFILETPDGYAIDFGTQFAVKIDAKRRTSDFELIEGEIEVHQPATGKSLRLTEVGEAASVSVKSLSLIEEPLLEEQGPALSDVVRISTQGRCATAMHNERRRNKSIRSGYLYASKTKNGKWDMRSYFEFDLSAVNLDQVAGVKLRLNQVQSYRGSAALLPKVNRFAIYGITNESKMNWGLEPRWEGSPTPDDGVLVATFEIPRSKMRGVIEIESPELTSFLKEGGGRSVSFILTRETGRIEGSGPAMPHMFASDKHPESVGPLLELSVK